MSLRIPLECFKVGGQFFQYVGAVSQNDSESGAAVISQSIIEYVEIPVGLIDMRIRSCIERVACLGLYASCLEVSVHLSALFESFFDTFGSGHQDTFYIEVAAAGYGY